jgi:hypothetical protein
VKVGAVERALVQEERSLGSRLCVVDDEKVSNSLEQRPERQADRGRRKQPLRSDEAVR